MPAKLPMPLMLPELLVVHRYQNRLQPTESDARPFHEAEPEDSEERNECPEGEDRKQTIAMIVQHHEESGECGGKKEEPIAEQQRDHRRDVIPVLRANAFKELVIRHGFRELILVHDARYLEA